MAFGLIAAYSVGLSLLVRMNGGSDLTKATKQETEYNKRGEHYAHGNYGDSTTESVVFSGIPGLLGLYCLTGHFAFLHGVDFFGIDPFAGNIGLRALNGDLLI